MPRLPDAAVTERRRQLVALVDQQPMTSAQITMALCKDGWRSVSHYLEQLHDKGLIVRRGWGVTCQWLTPRLLAELEPTAPPPTPTVRLPDLHRPFLPDAEVTECDGVRITRQAAPRGRFEVDLAPGSGVISADWRQRRESGQGRASS